MFFLCRPNTWLGQVPRIAIIMSAQMRIVVLIGSEELQHRFVERSLAELDNVSIVIATDPRLPLLKRINRARKRFGLPVAVSRVLARYA